MKKTFFTSKGQIQFLLFLLLTSLTKCEDEQPVPRDYPRLSGTMVTNVTDSGAVFSADLYALGNDSILQHGFIWSMTDGVLSSSERIFLGVLENTGIFSANVTTTLAEGPTYFVKPFVQTEKLIIYGPSFKFKSLGSRGPLLTDFTPERAGWGDTIKISGKNFSYLSNKVLLGNVLCSVVNSNDTVIYALVSDNVITDENPLFVEVSGTRATLLHKKFKLIPPTIKDFNPKQAKWGDTVSLSGKYLSSVSYYKNYIKLGNIACPIAAVNDTVVKFIVDYKVNSIINTLSMNLNGLTLTGTEPVTLLPPQTFFTFSPVEGTWNSLIALTGTFIEFIPGYTISFNSEVAPIQSISSTSIKILVPKSLKDSVSEIRYNVGPFIITPDNKFNLKPPIIKNFSPQSGEGGSYVTIKGKYFNVLDQYGRPLHKTIVKFGDTESTFVDISNDSTIICLIPSGIAGRFKISVNVNSQKAVSVNDFTIINPVITSITPQTGTFLNKITINGDNFNSSFLVRFGNKWATMVSASKNQIIAEVPTSMDSIPVKIYVEDQDRNTATSPEYFTLEPHIVSSASGEYSPGTDLRISGNNFNPEPSRNTVYWGSYKLKVKSATRTEIIAEWRTLPNGNNKIMVQAGGYKRYSTEIFTVNSAWTRIPSPQIATAVTNYGGDIQNFGYVFSPAMKATYRFNPVDKKWTNLGLTTTLNYYNEGSSVVLNNKLYVIEGYNNIHEYNPVNNLWQKYTFQMPAHVCFGLNNRLWCGGINQIEFYEINPESNFSYVSKGVFPLTYSNLASYFTIANKGYVIFSNKQVWQFNPNNLTWQRKNDFPGQGRSRAISFVIGDYAYFGLGVSDLLYDDIWMYDPSTDLWSLKTKIPVSRSAATVFTINNKAYIGFGYGENGNLFDFYEFDPSF